MIKAKIKQPQQKQTQLPSSENISPHESAPIVPKDPVFLDIVKSGKDTVCNLTTLNRLYDAWSIGCDDMEAAALVGISISPVNVWMREYPELREVRDRLRAQPRVSAKRNVVRRLNNDPTGEFSLKYLEKVKPDEFGGKGAVININGNVSVVEKTQTLTEFMGQFGADIIEGEYSEVTEGD